MAEFDDEDPLFTIDGREYCNDEEVLSRLLAAGVLLANQQQPFCSFQKKPTEATVVLYVNCNDLFAWGCADAEPLPLDELPRLWRLHRADPGRGHEKWCCLRRGEQPQPPVEKQWRDAGYWDAELESLKPNYYKQQCEKRKAATTNNGD